MTRHLRFIAAAILILSIWAVPAVLAGLFLRECFGGGR